ncbi:hypothetical protein [Methylomonas fluvii]|uniref:Uncharacterized protein n=1 Tax=Methylomonas fluvii TaxID=1854564 RepID=A0ABR9DK73_9GAMM|nr:hypothetical protein [Methylomonas fluvii]MBD9363425.1 hypothetical protein [Methylomonas fluvii]
MKFSFLHAIRQSKLMTVNGVIGVIESLDPPFAAGPVSTTSLFDFTSNNTIAMSEKLWH